MIKTGLFLFFSNQCGQAFLLCSTKLQILAIQSGITQPHQSFKRKISGSKKRTGY